jgi:hypothetical protein
LGEVLHADAAFQKQPQRKEVPSGGIGVHRDPTLAPAVLELPDGAIVRAADDLAAKIGPAVRLHNAGKGPGPVSGQLDVDKGVGKGNIDLSPADHLNVLVKGIGKNLAERETGFAAQIFQQLAVPLVGNGVGVLRQVGVGYGVLPGPGRQFFTVGKVHAHGRLVVAAPGQSRQRNHDQQHGAGRKEPVTHPSSQDVGISARNGYRNALLHAT